MKKLVLSCLLAFASDAWSADPSITGVMAQLENPWRGKVFVSYKVTGDISTEAKERGLVTSLKVTATDNDSNETYTAATLSGDMGLTAGAHSVVWDMEADGLSLKSSNVVFTVSCETFPALYCVVDLSAGSNASSYPVTYLAEQPSGGFNTDEYKTTKLVLRRIEPGTFIMGDDQSDDSHSVTLTKPFYVGLFEMTQRQYQLVTGDTPCSSSSCGMGNSYSLHYVSYDMIRGDSTGSQWPLSSNVDSSSFLGKVRTRTGLEFDLPTEAQWEYACRAGATTTYYWGDSINDDYAWYSANASGKANVVGEKNPNAWGIYDMSGNVWELCLDWRDDLAYGTDPKGASSGERRVVRGGGWYHGADYCTSFMRGGGGLSSDYYADTGFRLSRTLSIVDAGTGIIAGTSKDTNLARKFPCDLSEDLVAHYTFDGAAMDDSGNGNDGIQWGVTPTDDRHGKVNGAYHFNGTSSYIEVPDSDSLREVGQTVTLSAWVKSESWCDGWMSIMCKGYNDDCRQYGLQIYKENQWLVNMPNNSTENRVRVSKDIALRKWSHVAITYTPTEMSAYLNGELVGTLIPVGNIAENTNPLFIGFDPPFGDEYLSGDMDEVRIYNRALSAAEVRALANSDAPVAKNIGDDIWIYQYDFNDGVGLVWSGFGDLPSVLNIPDSIEEKQVVQIGSYAFYDSTNLEQVVLPNTIDTLTIGGHAFNSSTTVRIGDKEDYEFMGWKNAAGRIVPDPFHSGITVTVTPEWRKVETAIINGRTWKYSVTDGKATIGVVTAAVSPALEGDVVIPAELDGYPVTGIAANAFKNCVGMIGLTISSNVVTVGIGAFDGCSGLTNLLIEGDELFTAGLIQAKYNTRFDITSPLCESANVSPVSGTIVAYTSVPSGSVKFTDPLTGIEYFWNGKNTTFAYFGQMYMESGKTYVFGSHFDDDVYIAINGNVLINEQWEDEVTWNKICNGTFECHSSGWYDISARFSDRGGAKGACGNIWSSNFGVGYRDDGSTNTDQNGWHALLDSGDGSLFRFKGVSFAGCSNLVSVTMPMSMVTTMVAAFPDAYDKLKSVTLTGRASAIPEKAFARCTSLTNVVIPAETTGIGANAFAGCTSLESIVLPNEIETLTLGVNVCDAATEVVIADRDGHEFIGWRSGAGVGWIVADPFHSGGTVTVAPVWEKAETAVINGRRWKYSITDGKATIGVGTAAVSPAPEGDVVIPAELDGYPVTGIAANAFKNCGGMTSVTISSNVTSVGIGAFDGCYGLTNLVIESETLSCFMPGLSQAKFDTRFDTASTINDAENTANVSGVIAAYQHTDSAPWAFSDPMTGNVYYWNSVNSTIAYWGQIYLEEGKTYVFGSNFDDDVYVKIGDTIVLNAPNAGAKTVAMSTFVCEKSGWHGFDVRLGDGSGGKGPWGIGPGQYQGVWGENYGLEFRDDGCTITTQEGWRELLDSGSGSLFRCDRMSTVFVGCSNLVSVTMPWSMVTRMSSIFPAAYAHLEAVKLTGDVAVIPEKAFAGCANVRGVTMTSVANTLTIGRSAFDMAMEVTVATRDGYVVGWTNKVGMAVADPFHRTEAVTVMPVWKKVETSAIDGRSWVYTVDCNGFATIGNGTDVAVDPSPTGNVEIPGEIDGHAVVGIAECAFAGCTGITSMTIPSGITSIGKYAFSDCGGLTCVTIPDSVVNIGDGAFQNCHCIEELRLPDGGLFLGYNVFSGCDSIRSVVLPLDISRCGMIQVKFNARDDFTSSINEAIEQNKVSGALMGYALATNDQTVFADPIYGGSYMWNESNTTFAYAGWMYMEADKIYVFGKYFDDSVYIVVDGVEVLRNTDCEAFATGCYASQFTGWHRIEARVSDYYGDKGPLGGDSDKNLWSADMGIGWRDDGITNATPEATWCRLMDPGDGSLLRVEANATLRELLPDAYMFVTNVAFEAFSCTTVPAYCLDGCISLANVTIPEGVTSIERSAFSGCSGLTNMAIPDSVTNIYSSAFSGCANITSVKIPEYVCDNGLSSVFPSSYQSITNVVISDSVTNIASYAFSDCSGLASVAIPDCVTNIGEYAFRNCDGLTSVTIPDSVTGVDGYAFSGCSNLTSVTIPQYVCSKGLSSVFPSLYKSITNVIISDSVTNIAYEAFRFCSGLASVTIPDSVTIIGDYAFCGCSGLTSVTIPDSVTIIGDYAFYICGGLTSVTIPASVTNIGISAFATWSSLTSFVVDPSNAYYKSDNGMLLTKDGAMLVAVGAGVNGDVAIPDGVTSIGSYAFKGCSGLTSVTIPDSVTSIGEQAFTFCDGLTSVTMPTCVTNIGSYAFYNCSGLTSVTIPDSVTSIGYSAFYGCSGLTSVTMPTCVTNIGSYAFYNCSGLTSVTMPTCVTDIGSYAFAHCYRLASVTIPDGVTSIGSCAFKNCSGLTSVTVPDSVKEIGKGAFSGCSALTNMVLPFVGSKRGNYNVKEALFGYVFGSAEYLGSSLVDSAYKNDGEALHTTNFIPSSLRSLTITDETRLGYGAFERCNMLTDITLNEGISGTLEATFYHCTNLARLNIPHTITEVGRYAFEGCNSFENMIIPDSVVCVGYRAFRECNGLTNVVIGAGVTKIGDNAFQGCTSLTSMSFPEGLRSIGEYAFYGCSNLKGVAIPKTLSSTGYKAFRNCGLKEVHIQSLKEWCYISHGSETGNPLCHAHNLYLNGQLVTNLVVPKGTTYIGYVVFREDTSITNATIPASVTSIRKWAFENCRNLRSVMFEGNAPTMGESVFNGVSSDCCAYVHRASTGWGVSIPGTWNGIAIDYFPQHVVTLEANGGVCSSNAVYAEVGTEIGELPVPTLEGYEFLGWFTESVGGELVDATTIIDEPVTLYAHWRFAVAAPVIEADSAVFLNASQTISISCTMDGTIIYYTTDGSDPMTNGREYTKPFAIYKSCTVRAIAVFDGNKESYETSATFTRGEVLSEAANLYGLTMDTAGDASWTVDSAMSHDGVSSLRSGDIDNDGITYILASVRKAGTVTFWWRAACEEADEEDGEDGYFDYGVFLVDGVAKARIAGNDTGWRFVSVDVPTGGKHTLRWEYRKDGVDSYQPDCIWLDQVQWIPADGSGYTLTTPEPVPYSWFDEYGLGAGTDYETAGNAASGKADGMGKPLSVWQDYVAGTDPTNATSRFTAKIEMVDGAPVVTWEPNLNTNGFIRTYKLFGKENLSDPFWYSPTNSLHRFFKVSVELP